MQAPLVRSTELDGAVGDGFAVEVGYEALAQPGPSSERVQRTSEALDFRIGRVFSLSEPRMAKARFACEHAIQQAASRGRVRAWVM